MPSTDATLAWAVQVNVERLGAHLEAYVNLLPTFNAVRLCNRFGRGPNAEIVRLPPELIGIVEDFLLSEERAKIMSAWHTDFECYLLNCEPEDHMTCEQLEQLLDKAKADKTIGATRSVTGNDDDDDDPEYRVYCHLRDEFDEWSDIHMDRSHSWRGRVGMPGAERRGTFTKHADLIKKHFGLDVWISHVRLNEYPWEGFWQFTELDPPQSTVAYLTLPGATNNFIPGDMTKWEIDEKDFFVESGYGMPVHIPPPLSESARTRFKRMMQILDLKPFLSGSQAGLDLHADESASKAAESRTHAPQSISEVEPQLTMLIRTIVRSDEMED